MVLPAASCPGALAFVQVVCLAALRAPCAFFKPDGQLIWNMGLPVPLSWIAKSAHIPFVHSCPSHRPGQGQVVPGQFTGQSCLDPRASWLSLVSIRSTLFQRGSVCKLWRQCSMIRMDNAAFRCSHGSGHPIHSFSFVPLRWSWQQRNGPRCA